MESADTEDELFAYELFFPEEEEDDDEEEDEDDEEQEEDDEEEEEDDEEEEEDDEEEESPPAPKRARKNKRGVFTTELDGTRHRLKPRESLCRLRTGGVSRGGWLRRCYKHCSRAYCPS